MGTKEDLVEKKIIMDQKSAMRFSSFLFSSPLSLFLILPTREQKSAYEYLNFSNAKISNEFMSVFTAVV